MQGDSQVIRFSAALVAVAIGVLIGGIATSKLLLVYIAIVVSAVALLTLAIGVVLKREELFGEGQGLVPAGVGAAPVPSPHAGEGQVQPRQDTPVPPSAPLAGPTGYGTAFEGTAFDGAGFGGTGFAGAAQAAPSGTAEPSTSRQPPAGPGRDRVADPVSSWESQSARDQWSSSPWQSGPAVQGGPVVGGAPADTPVADSPVAGRPAGGHPVTDGTPDWMPGGWGANGPAAAAGASAPSSPAVTPGARQEPAPPEPAPRSWFDRRPQPAETAQPAVTGTQANAAPADEDLPAHQDVTPGEGAAPADEDDDDWPTRYSWLDDEPDESSGESDPLVSPADDASGTDAVSEPPTVGRSVFDPEPPTVGRPAFDPGQDTGPAEDTGPEPEPVLADGEPPAADPPGAAEADGLVSVLRGVPRYHQPDCVLIRFLPEGDIQRLPVAQATADGCTPCAACQPAD
jgi:hypothetical protein